MKRGGVFAAVLLGLLAFTPVFGEPSFAVRTGHRCWECHTNRTGGGLRTAYGSLYGQTTLPARLLKWDGGGVLLPADPAARFAVGADVRFQALAVNHRESADSFSFEIPEANAYVEARLLPGRFSLYLDETLGPGGASTRELFGLFAFSRGNSYVKVGKFLPAFGWRLPDDEAFIRQFSGFTYSAPDIGIEIGAEPGRWSLHLAAHNGTSGGSEDNRAKQVSLLAVRRFENFRVGVSGSNNNASGGARTTAAGILGGVNFGRLTLLGEADWLEQETSEASTDRLLALVEADLLVARGWNFKLARDYIDPDRDVRTDARIRDTFAVEYVPIPFLQLRLAVQRRDGPPQVHGSQDKAALFELHFYL